MSRFGACQVYAFNVRLHLVENALESPAVVSPTAPTCPTTPRTFVNWDSCVLAATCMPLSLVGSTPVVLDAASLQTFYDLDGKYLYSLVGLRTEASRGCSFLLQREPLVLSWIFVHFVQYFQCV